MGGIVAEDEVTLRDGSRVLIRPVQPADKALFAESWEHFGEESRYRRFLGAKGELSARDLAYFTEVDHVDHEAIGAADSVTREAIGLARYDRDNERPHIATASVTVEEAWRGRSVDERLTRSLTARAIQNGIRIFVVDGVERPLS